MFEVALKLFGAHPHELLLLAGFIVFILLLILHGVISSKFLTFWRYVRLREFYGLFNLVSLDYLDQLLLAQFKVQVLISVQNLNIVKVHLEIFQLTYQHSTYLWINLVN